MKSHADKDPRYVILDLVLTFVRGMPTKAGTASVLDGSLLFAARNHRDKYVMLTTKIFFDGEPTDEDPPRFVLRRLGPHVWKLVPSVLDDNLHAYLTIVDVPEPPPWVKSI